MIKSIFKKIFAPFYRRYLMLVNKADKKEVDSLYKLLYNKIHDVDMTLPLAATQTVDAFSFQWDKLQEGEAMLSDEWFRDNVTNIISQRETLIDEKWFAGKDIIDCGCGGGRWSYGMAKLGANITAVDINKSALLATEKALEPFDVKKQFIQTPLEELSESLGDKKFDMAWSWGVLHHCNSFTKAFDEVQKVVKPGGFIYLYLYGRESLTYEEDINLFKNRVRYNTLFSWEEKKNFLLEKANGDITKLHQNHDIFSPLLNRRLEFDYMKNLLEKNGFTDIQRTVKHTELHIRARKLPLNESDDAYLLSVVDNKAWYLKYFI